MRRFERAMVLLLVTSLSAAAAPTATREAEVRVVLVALVDGGVAAQLSSVTVRVARNKSGAPSVGVLSATSDPGDQWLPMLWQAALVAADATQTSLSDSEFSARVTAPAHDGAAGLLTASTLVALLRNKTPRADTTLLGSINPDGSAGFVDDALARLGAARAGGVKRLGIPFGARQQPGPDGAVLDLVLEGQKLGVEVRELAGLDDAYGFLTGDRLPRPVAAAEADMELWPAELAAMNRVTAGLRSEVDTERSTLDVMLDGGVSAASANALRARLDRSAKQAGDFQRSGDAVRAFVVWGETLALTRVAMQDVQFLQSGEPRSLLETQRAALPGERAALRREIDERFPPNSRANDMYAMDVLESIVTQGAAFRAEEEAAAKDAETKARQLAEALLRGREDVQNGQRFVQLYASLPKLKKRLPPLDAARLAASYVAARGVLRAHERLEQDPSFAELRGYEALLGTETDDLARLVLAARQHLYTAHLLNVYGAFGAELSEQSGFTLRNPRTLSSQLEYARAQALQSCGRAGREATMIPLAAKLRYLNARAGREGTERQKTEALADLWVANWWCALAVSRTVAKP